jgi:nitroreductase
MAMLVMTFDEVILERTSVRAFKPTPVAHEIIVECLNLARKAPSNCNSQPWMVEIVSGDTLTHLQEAMLLAMAGPDQWTPDILWLNKLYPAYLKDRQTEHLTHLQTVFGTHREDPIGRGKLLEANLKSFGAPHLALLYMPGWGNEREAADVGHFGQSLMMALWSRGVGSAPQTSIAMAAGTIRSHLGLDDTRKLLYGISFGYERRGLPESRLTQDRANHEDFVRFHT